MYIVLSILILFIFYYYSETTLSRIADSSDVKYGGLGIRMEYWELYLMDIKNNPIYLFFGNFAPPTYHRSPHNFFIYITFSVGILFLVLIFIYIEKFLKARKKITKRYKLWSLDPKFILIPQLLFWGMQNEAITWFGLILLMTCGVFLKNHVVIRTK